MTTESEMGNRAMPRLTAPPSAPTSESDWAVVAYNRKVNKSWEALVQRAPENCARCYEHLARTPLQRWPGGVYPLRGKKYPGAWGYEVTSGDRVYYVPNEREQRVVVYFAGPHPDAVPSPP